MNSLKDYIQRIGYSQVGNCNEGYAGDHADDDDDDIMVLRTPNPEALSL